MILGLKEGQYKDPKYNIKRRAKIVNVIVTYVPPEMTETCPARSNIDIDDYVWYDENKLDTIKFNLECHKHYNAGVDYDIIIVDNGSKNDATQRYLKYLEDEEGIRVFRRENIGFSFAGFKYAWEQLKEEYDYFLFNEQDGVPTRDGWLLEILQKFHSDKDVGAVGNNVEDFDLTKIFGELKKLCPYIGNRNITYNLDGFMTFTSSSILRKVDKIGGLFVLPIVGDKDAERNELIFQQPILELGYKIVAFNDGEHKYYAGVSILDDQPEFKDLEITKITPMTLAHTRFFTLKAHFDWYNNE